MKDYKKKIEEFIEDLNNLLNDRLYLPNPVGNYEVLFSENDSEIIFELHFVEQDDRLIFIKKSTSFKSPEFYQKCYIITFRMIMFGLDTSFGKTIDPSAGIYIHYLSPGTLANEGLKKYREWKEGAKHCFSCKSLNNESSEKCSFCGEEFK